MRSGVDNALSLTRIELAVLAAGTSTMGLEILAGRIIAPEFGSSVYTWGSIIGVFLAALSLGYHRGGNLATTTASDRRMATLLLYAATYVALVIFAGDILLRVASSFPVPARFLSLLPVILLFGPPVYFLGFITPYAVELSEKTDTGDAAGHIFALGTLGSIVGAFATTFFLIPTLSVELIGFLFGAILILAATHVVWPASSRKSLASILLVTVLLIAAVAGNSAGITAPGTVVYQTQTPYQELQVVDNGDVRTLYLGGHRHSAMSLESPNEHVFDYTRYFHLPLLMRDDIDRVLFIGGGGFTGPKIFASKYNVTVDVVEIDPVVIDTAKTHFNVTESEQLTIHTGDGRQFLESTSVTYDVIILDAYQKDKVPFHLTTEEFMALAASRLDDNGILLANVISAPAGPGSKFYRAEYKTMNRVFPQVYSFPTSSTGMVQNIELVASKTPRRFSEEDLRQRNRDRDIGIDLDREIQSYEPTVKTSDVPVLKDKKAPVAQLLDPMLGQKYIIESNETLTEGKAQASQPPRRVKRETLSALLG